MTLAKIVVHGGAGLYSDGRFDEARDGCRTAASAGLQILQRGGSSLDAVTEAVRVLEDDPEFNAGTGSCLTAAGTVEMDACLMSGVDLRAGGVASIRGIRNPIVGARVVMEQSVHDLLCGDGAQRFLLDHGVQPWPEEALITPRALSRTRASVPDSHGTVGAVAIDSSGHLAAATSTGGVHGKLPGRIGDTPIPGAGTFADDLAGAASATGVGEPILRVQLSRAACDLAATWGAQTAAERALQMLRERVAGVAGLIVLGSDGAHGISHTTLHMSWAWADAGGGADARCD